MNNGSEFYNYKNLFSTILLAIVDVNYCFAAIDRGTSGRNSDSNVN